MNMTDEKRIPNAGLKKTLAVATVVASLGLSLGVPVADLMAADANPSANPIKLANPLKGQQSQQSKVSNQIKDMNSVEDLTNRPDLTSNQGKFRSTTVK